MTFGTIPVLVCTGEYRFVVILVTGIAVAEFQRLDKIGDVTILAVHGCVFALQRKVCIGMVEVLRNSRNFETFLVVTRLALAAEFTLVHVLVADNTVCILYPDPVLKYFSYRNLQIVAVPATDGLVFPREGKPCSVVVEFVVQYLESLLRVTFLAVVAQFVFVYVLMTTVAIGKGHPRKSLKFCIVSGLFRVTLNTSHVLVLARQRIVCLFMPEL